MAGKAALSNHVGAGNASASRSRSNATPNSHPASSPIPVASPMNRNGPAQQTFVAMPPSFPHTYGNMMMDTAGGQDVYESMGHHSMPPSPGNRSPYQPQMYPYMQQQHPNQFAFPGKLHPNSFEGGLPSPGGNPSFMMPPMSPSMNRNLGYPMHMQVPSQPGPLQMPMAVSPDGRHHHQYYTNSNNNNNNNNNNFNSRQFIIGNRVHNNSASIYPNFHNNYSGADSEDLAGSAFLVDDMWTEKTSIGAESLRAKKIK